MNLIPWGQYTLEIAQSPDVVCRRLQHETTKRWITALQNRSRFCGKVEKDRIEICYMGFKEDSEFMKRNSFCPIFCGKIYEENGKTVLQFKWHLSALVFAIMTVFIGISFFAEVPFFLLVYALIMWGLNMGLKDTKAAIRDTIIMPGEWWREYEDEYEYKYKGDERNV